LHLKLETRSTNCSHRYHKPRRSTANKCKIKKTNKKYKEEKEEQEQEQGAVTCER